MRESGRAGQAADQAEQFLLPEIGELDDLVKMCMTSDHVLQILQKTGSACTAVGTEPGAVRDISETVGFSGICPPYSEVRKQLDQPILKLDQPILKLDAAKARLH